MKSKTQKTVYVGISGGVDSSVAAALLLDKGYSVEGVFIRTWQPEWLECTWKEERRDAMRVCAKLGIRFHELDLSQVYKKEVADYMIAEYRTGRTPNPDVMCNREVKFGGFMDWALEHGADAVATGHYARVLLEESGPVLARGVDTAKDQSYFLWTLPREKLAKVLFPVGELTKKEVRSVAKKKGLLTAGKKDSQGICFLGPVDMKEFLGHYISEKPGKVLDEVGNVVGHHPGALFFTLGERRGFTITQKTDHDSARYIVSKDIEANTITVAENITPSDKNRDVLLEQVVLRIPSEEVGDKTLVAEIRYHGKAKNCGVEVLGNTLKVSFSEHDPTITAGQSIVLYDGAKCIGGGVVAE